MNNPFFSVIIPAHNSAEYIVKGLQSISEQTFRSYELIVVCDNCTDNTEDVAQAYGATTYDVCFGRDGLARDYGISQAHGDWILFMDDDDWFLHEFVFQMIHDEICRCENEYGIEALAFGYIFRHRGYKAPYDDELFTPRIAHVWSKAWKRETVIQAGARFGDAVFCSDTYFLRDMNMAVHNIGTLNMPMYYYNFMRAGSQTDLFCRGIIHQSPVAE